LLRVSHLHQHEISRELADEILVALEPELKNADLLVFSDFNYGCLPQFLVDEIMKLCRKYTVSMAADSQSSSQVGDIGRYKGMLLVTPTEHEARLAIRDKDLGLAALAQGLQHKSDSKNVFITLGGEGLLVVAKSSSGEETVTDQLPEFNLAPKDVAGAGDSLLICAAMALVVGATGWEAAYLGSVAAACQVGRVGNFPLTADEVVQELAF
jgi:bifunctional ADP-heptose synthase (sugar kinase/adenylyltransferase)